MPREELPDDWKEIVVALGIRIRQIREREGMTQEQLGHAAGLSRNQVQNIENARNNAPGAGPSSRGPGNPKLSTLVNIARALNVSVADLLPDRI